MRKREGKERKRTPKKGETDGALNCRQGQRLGLHRCCEAGETGRGGRKRRRRERLSVKVEKGERGRAASRGCCFTAVCEARQAWGGRKRIRGEG